MSSEPAAAPVASAYAFPQLETTAVTTGGISDVLSEAVAEAEQMREQARRAGVEEGRAAGISAAREEVDAALAAVGAVLREMQALRQDFVAGLERDAVELAFTLAEQILAGVLAVEPERVLDVARNALRRVVDRRRVTLVVNPDDLAILADSVAQLQSELGGIEHCDVQADRRIGRGGAILRTEAGEVDVTVSSQLERAREIVIATLTPPATPEAAPPLASERGGARAGGSDDDGG